MSHLSRHFEPQRHERQLVSIIREIHAEETLDARTLHRIVRRHPKEGRSAFSKAEIISGFRFFAPYYGWQDGEASFVEKVRMKPVRTLSGVAPVTVLTRPHPCPGRCIFCPADARLPKSYLAREPGAQRALQHGFDPYGQTMGRLQALYNTGHQVDKVELIVLGGTWSSYPEPYRIWFIKRCFDAMNEFAGGSPGGGRMAGSPGGGQMAGCEEASWAELERVQVANERSRARCVGLVVETRPDRLSEDEVGSIRRFGGTKVQIGIQSLSDRVLAVNRRDHDVAATRRAMRLLRQAGFKIHAHWMPNLLGSNPEADLEDFDRLFADPDFRPDEVKIYPCSLIAGTELMRAYESGAWRPYTDEELLRVLCECLVRVPPYCRVTRVIRDIPGDEIAAGNKVTNLREVVERELRRRGLESRDIRAREIRREPVEVDQLRLERLEYATSTGWELFLQFVTQAKRLVAFCRLALPRQPAFLSELGRRAVVREVHVYGVLVAIGDQRRGSSQHLGLGRRLIGEAARIAAARGYDGLAVISAVGTRDYYRGLGFEDGELYQHRPLPPAEVQIEKPTRTRALRADFVARSASVPPSVASPGSQRR
ncbi:MAG: tRNA uridine(34) 5-carboxymethylaminomethyl modification radical SAM/GNAT enzyme Elp3 [bacterium]|nr:tRNA uridine(34) 5-carboxymethylaminomethyl modification radical SAM/GNAT enzyme Elp3 [bacterium]